ncbi:gluconokinase [Deinococcus taeanensis]|uniref:gluconokinase n=1 Tax=Deinococcus taeanensis TaxID=2737050 RepID=UPI001CDD733C|nr:gluconokinase [Deinococcus taeanensis]UBV43368.1 gluconokinase [Deinococcus taeanensis]
MTSNPGEPQRLIVMGVSGSGKTSVGEALAAALHTTFLDADNYHTTEARARMHAGQALTDADRAPWLARLRQHLCGHGRLVLACSALKRAYRDELRVPGVQFLFLDVPELLLRDRLQRRTGHYAGVSLLDSQLTTLQRPGPDEPDVHTLPVSAGDTTAALVRRATALLNVR